MGKRDDKRNLKMCVLDKIKTKKSILFGAFTKTLTKEIKNNAWNEISTYAKSLGVIASNQDSKYLRDVWWPNVRKSCMQKIDNAKQTGSGGGIDKKINEVDNAVLDIVGKDSPVMIGLGVPDSLESEEISNNKSITDINNDEKCTETIVPALHDDVTQGVSLKNFNWKTKNSNRSVEKPPIGTPELDNEKKILQIKLLKAQIYKTTLECRQLELAMGLDKSEFTKNIPCETTYVGSEDNVFIIDGKGTVIASTNAVNTMD